MSFFQRIRTPFSESPADEQARLQPRMRLIGGLLQERREDLGLELDEVGAMLKIRPAYLAALEQGRLNDLPGPAYAIGFVRAYAEFLGLDSEQVLVRFKAEAAGATARPDLALPVPLGERSLPGGAMVLVALILALCGYGIWYYLSTEERNRPERVAAVPAALDKTPPVPALVAPPVAGAPTAADSPSEPTAPSLFGAAASPSQPGTAPAPVPSVVPSPPPAQATVPTQGPQSATMARTTATGSPASPQAAPPAQQAAIQPQTASPAPPASAAPIANAPAPAGAGRVSIRALTDCWIQVRAPDQSIVFSRVLKSGETYNVPSRAGLSLRTGNAGALEIAVDGKTAPSIGAIGALRRDVALDPTELAAGTAVHG